MSRLLQIALAIPDARNGIHHTILEPVWRGIAALAHAYQVQVFATSHSRECIDAALEAFRGTSQASFAVHRVESSSGGVRAMTYDLEMLEAAAEIGAEVR